MNVLFDREQLLRLVTNLCVLTGAGAGVLDAQGREVVFPDRERPPFCRAVSAPEEGRRRCGACGRQDPQDHGEGVLLCRCHAGVCKAAAPLGGGERPLAYLVSGGFLDKSPLDGQWARASALLDWYPGGAEQLRNAFFRLRRYSDREIRAYAELLQSLASYVQLKGMVSAAERTDLQKLDLYLDQHYREKLSLAGISAQLHIGRTKLCRLAKELSGGETLTHLVTRRRVEAAKRLLLEGDEPISAVAEAVGISDYNYFSRVFRAATGTTPRDFREAGRKGGRDIGQID